MSKSQTPALSSFNFTESNLTDTSRLEIGPNIWNLAIIDNIDIRDHTYSYGNIFDVTCNTKHAVVRTSLQYKLPHPVETPIDDSEQILPEPIFSDQFANEWIEKYDDIFSVLYEENNKDFGMEKINESIRKYIKTGLFQSKTWNELIHITENISEIADMKFGELAKFSITSG
nr:661_t:CDS:2 [Entrophospora candida]